MNNDIIWQWIVVGIILAGVIAWIIIKLVKNRNNPSNPGCSRCGLRDACNEKDRAKSDYCK